MKCESCGNHATPSQGDRIIMNSRHHEQAIIDLVSNMGSLSGTPYKVYIIPNEPVHVKPTIIQKWVCREDFTWQPYGDE